MPTPAFQTKPATSEPAFEALERNQTYDRFEDEEKIIAGDLSANMQAFLTRDVQGG